MVSNQKSQGFFAYNGLYKSNTNYFYVYVSLIFKTRKVSEEIAVTTSKLQLVNFLEIKKERYIQAEYFIRAELSPQYYNIRKFNLCWKFKSFLCSTFIA